MQEQTDQWRKGIAIALATYLFWGLFPLYFKLFTEISAVEVLIHRIVWSCVFTLILANFMSLGSEIRSVLRDFKKLRIFFLSACLLGLNWLIFIYGITNDAVLQLSLGYFINPLFNMIFGLLLFKEKISLLVRFAIVLVVLGLSIQLINFSAFPWLAVCVAFIFSAYGAVRKTTKVNAVSGLFIETLILLAPAVIYIVAIQGGGSYELMKNSWTWAAAFIVLGPLTSVPLLSFAMAVQLIPYYLVGFCQYITPTMLFILAVYVFDETWSTSELLTFVLVWSGVLLSLISSIRSILLARRQNVST